jgi:hypothetical protein
LKHAFALILLFSFHPPNPAIVVESTFALWVGYRGYNYASHQSKGSYQTISEIPLCKGRSRMAEALCPEWIDITKNQVPASFWNVYENGALRDDNTWTAIRQFSLNCERRAAFEDKVRQDCNMSTNEPVLLSERIPDGFLPSSELLSLEKESVSNLVSDKEE